MDDIYKISDRNTAQARDDYVDWLITYDRFICSDNANSREVAARHFDSPELVEVILRAYLVPDCGSFGYCRTWERFLESISSKFISLVAVAILWRLRGWKKGCGRKWVDPGEFSVEAFKGIVITSDKRIEMLMLNSDCVLSHIDDYLRLLGEFEGVGAGHHQSEHNASLLIDHIRHRLKTRMVQVGYINDETPCRRIAIHTDPERDDFIRQLEEAHLRRLQAAAIGEGEANAIGNDGAPSMVSETDDDSDISGSELHENLPIDYCGHSD